jgi:hypothetical protein
VEDYATKYESEGMKKVVNAIKNAWRRDKGDGKAENDSPDAKRRKIE